MEKNILMGIIWISSSFVFFCLYYWIHLSINYNLFKRIWKGETVLFGISPSKMQKINQLRNLARDETDPINMIIGTRKNSGVEIFLSIIAFFHAFIGGANILFYFYPGLDTLNALMNLVFAFSGSIFWVAFLGFFAAVIQNYRQKRFARKNKRVKGLII